MDIVFLYQGQRFVWDSEKATTNIGKHGVSFEKACEVFFDPFVMLDDAGTVEDNREAAIGMTEDWDLLFVVHILREEDTLRIISARAATTAERRKYEDE
jgi:uncharacterized DUF497 family protein